MELSYECPICHKKYAVITDMANCIIADEKKRKEDNKIKELIEAENSIKMAYEKLKSAVNKYNRLSDSKTYVCTLTSSGQSSKSYSNSTQTTGKCSCGEKCENENKNKNDTANFTFDIDEDVIKELSERIASGDIFKLFSGI